MNTSAGPHLVTVAYGPAALFALRRQISEYKGTDPLAPVIVIVPNNFVGLSTRRALAGGAYGPLVGDLPGLVGVDFSTSYRLAELLGAHALANAGRRPVSVPLIAAAVRQVLERRPGYFGRIAQHPTTERRLVAVHRELAELGPQELDELASLSDRAADVVRVHRAVLAILDQDWFGEADLVREATAVARSDPWRCRQLGGLMVFLPQHMTALSTELIRAVAEHVPSVVIAGLCGVREADAEVRDIVAALGMTPSDPALSVEEAPRLPQVLITSVSDADDEVRHVIRGVVQAAREGVRLDRMAVVLASPDPYLRLLADHFDAAAIPINGAALVSVGESIAGRILGRLLSLSDRDYRREDVMGLLAAAPMRWQGGVVPVRAWDLISRHAGIVKGPSDWQGRLTLFIDDATEDLSKIGDDPEFEWRARHLRRRVALAVRLRSFMEDLVTRLTEGATASSWVERSNWCRRALRQYMEDPADWPEHERRAADRVDQILDRLAGLDRVDKAPTMAVFRRTLEMELDGGLGRTGSFGNGVLVGHAASVVGLDLDRVWIVGLSEGTFPSRPRDDSLLPDRERGVITGLRLRSDRVGDEHRQYLAALASVGEHGQATLLVPRGDLRQSNERVPSRWLVDTAQELASDPLLSAADLDDTKAPWFRHVASFASGILSSTFPPNELEYDLRDLAETLEQNGTLDGHRLLAPPSHLASGAEMQHSRRSRQFTRFDGNLRAVDIEDPTTSARATSATALETWARCPHQYFVRNFLRVDPLETPELRLRIDPLSKGRLVHAILEEFMNVRVQGPPGPQPYGWSEDDHKTLGAIARRHFDTTEARGLTGEQVYWRRDQVLIMRDLHQFLELDSDRRIEDRLRPVATEAGFGLGGDAPVEVRLNDGRTLNLRGSMDLIDESVDGGLVVIDYKTGKATRVSEDDPHGGGTKLQLVLYAIAARATLGRPDAAVDSSYWYISAASGYRRVGYPVTARIEEDVLAAVGTVVDGIAAGVFPQHPEDTTRSLWVSCPYCDPDALGVADARRRFVRKAGAPELVEYLALTEPNLLPPAVLATGAQVITDA